MKCYRIHYKFPDDDIQYGVLIDAESEQQARKDLYDEISDWEQPIIIAIECLDDMK